MSDCKGDCKKKSCAPSSSKIFRETPISDYLAPPPKANANATPLTDPCKCYYNSRLPRSSCLKCIKEWCNAVCVCEIEKEIEKYKRSVITTDRLKQCLEDKKREEAFRDNDYCPTRCINCRSKYNE